MGEEVFPWLKSMPLAPEYHPTLSEFQDPIAYIHKIEKEASLYGICKIVPPLPPPPKKSVVSNLNKSLFSRSSSLTFTTRQQQIGFCPRKPCPVKKPVWQSGQRYFFPDFESKARSFERSYLKKLGKKPPLSPLELETLYWKASVDKPLSVEYANDIPGSAFPPNYSSSSVGCGGVGSSNVGETAWNMRWVSRAEGSLLRYMKEEIPGVTSPMVYLAMMFSWFAWHVEDHDLHSLNYLHLGAPKTWYGVPRDACVAFEEVVRVNGYGGEVNPLVTFAVLGEKTTVISPEVLVAAGVPCCRLVQNAGEFVVTFPRAYHSGFSHGFNCGEASNIATPEWLKFAKEAAVRRASINYPPMVSHFQLLYDLALALCSRVPAGIHAGPRSSRLKDKKKGEGEATIKDEFLRNVIENNKLLQILGKGSPIVLIPQSSSDASAFLNLCVGSYSRVAQGNSPLDGYSKIKPKLASLCERKSIPLLDANGDLPKSGFRILDRDSHRDELLQDDRLSHQRLFSCVTCGILTFDCAAVIQPREQAARYLMSADCNFLDDWTNSGVLNDNNHPPTAVFPRKIGQTEYGEESVAHGLYSMPGRSSNCLLQGEQNGDEEAANSEEPNGTSALGLLAQAYGNSSDSEEDRGYDLPDFDDDTLIKSVSPERRKQQEDPRAHIMKLEQSSGPDDDAHLGYGERLRFRGSNVTEKSHQILNYSIEKESNDYSRKISCESDVPLPGCNEGSSRLHVFCLEHAIDVEEQLRLVGGVHISLFCYQDYPRVEAEAKHLAEELGIDYSWNNITFRNATTEDEKRIQSALDSEEAIPGNGDWAVKLGKNLFCSANLCWSPLYSKQMPYNSVIYKAFGRDSSSLPAKADDLGQRSGKPKKTVAGKWCGKVWMSHRVHPLLVQKDPEDQDEESCVHENIEGTSKGRTETSTARKPVTKRKMEEDTKRTKKDINGERGASEDLLVYSRQHHQKFGVLRPSKTIKWQNFDTDNQADDDARLSCEGVLNQLAGPREGQSANSGSKFAPDSLSGHDSPSNDLLEDSYLSQKIPKGKRAKLNRGDAVLSRKFEEKCYFRTNRRMFGTKQESIGSEDAVSNDEDEGPQQQMNQRRERVSQNARTCVGALHQIKGLKKLYKSRKQVVSGLMKVTTECTKKQEHSEDFDDVSDGEEVKGRLNKRVGKRTSKPSVESGGSKLVKGKSSQTLRKNNSKPMAGKRFSGLGIVKKEEEGEYQCDLEGCTMAFFTSKDLNLHKKNVCPVKGCGKKFFSHKYLVQHRRVHLDDRPLKCPWKRCKMTFKWAWARTEHIRVHTGERPYKCGEPNCGQTFRFVSDFSRHKRKTGHSIKGKG
ncbi:hypothetical protein MLD38_032696 [Melastoma candidum]|uniref:Uncharacterized protein n=1 Tax=Melastoma candidum TaxID=119954 RepID=A0ACB9M496_9MYRT|nr:hypothetical protein MLD38_032696 [Melastoma candidum]